MTLRALDLPLQYYILRSSLIPNMITRLGGSTIPQPLAHSGGLLGLTPYHTLIMGLATGSALKQIYWKLAICDTVMDSNFCVLVAVYNTLLNTLNTGLALWSLTSQQPPSQSSWSSFLTTASPTILAGLGIYSIGLFVEWWCEIQRRSFKSKPENKGKPYSGGLFGLARNINYGGYTLWRTGYSLISAGWIWGGLQAVWLAGDFCARAIPSLDAYCEKRVSTPWDC